MYAGISKLSNVLSNFPSSQGKDKQILHFRLDSEDHSTSKEQRTTMHWKVLDCVPLCDDAIMQC